MSAIVRVRRGHQFWETALARLDLDPRLTQKGLAQELNIPMSTLAAQLRKKRRRDEVVSEIKRQEESEIESEDRLDSSIENEILNELKLIRSILEKEKAFTLVLKG